MIRNFAGLAMGANYAYESDLVAEQKIEDYYVSAFEQMQQITKSSSDEQRAVCFEELSSAGCDAKTVNDSSLEIALSFCGLIGPSSYSSPHAAITGPEYELSWGEYLGLGLVLAGPAIIYFGAGLIESPFFTEGGTTFFNTAL